MKIHHKLFLAFSVIALLAGVVALYSLNATRQIIRSFEGGDEHFQMIIEAANDVGSYTKRAQSELMLFLTLEKKADREQFFRHYRLVERQIGFLERIVKERDALGIIHAMRQDSKRFLAAAQVVLQEYDRQLLTTGTYDPVPFSKQIRSFFAVSSNVMQAATDLANLETDFLNKQFAIMNASTINHLAKITEGQLLLYMLLNDQRDLEKYLVGFQTLEATLAKVKTRVRDGDAVNIIEQIATELAAFGKAGQALFESFHGEQQRQGRLDLQKYAQQLRNFHSRSSNIRELGVALSNLMSKQEYQKKEVAMHTASSIQRSVIFFVVVGGALTLLLGYFLSATVAKPIILLREAALRIGKGELDAADSLSGRGELGELAATMQQMGHQLRLAHNELLAAKEYTDNILRSMSDALCVVSLDGRVKTVNEAMCRLLKAQNEELTGQPFDSLFHGEPPFRFLDEDLEQRSNIQPLITQFRDREGNSVYVSFSSSPMFDTGGEMQGVVCVAQDMTTRLQNMKELRQLATVVEQAAEAIVVSDTRGIIQYVNPAFETITGYRQQEAVGRNINILKSGRQSKQFYKNLWTTIRKGEVWSGQLINRRKDGTLYDEECTISPVYDDAREIINYVALKRDVTNELRLERQLQQAQKHEALGTLAGGVAHDFNNILSGILAYAEGTLADLPEGSTAYQNIEEIIKAGRRAADLVSQILTFSRPTKQMRKSILLQPLIKGALKLLRGTMPSTITINSDIGAECPTVLADSTQMHQVIVNLCTNAYHAMRDRGGELSVSLQECVVTPQFAAEHHDLSPGRYARVRVQDTGIGMDAATQQRIFEPYFSTKKPGEGTGLGLATVHGIIESHNGAILVSSELGGGSRFDVYLPIHIEQATVSAAPDRAKAPALTGHILFVDDEQIIVQSMSIVLKQIGCRVSTYTSSVKALAAFRDRPEDFDLVITDQTMPGLTGAELAREILSIRADIPIILTTGFSETINEEQAKQIGIREFMMKPMVVDELKTKVGKLLADNGGRPEGGG